jgi:hypothetical protein
MRSGGLPAGSSRALRLDPFALPVRFAANDAAADERVRDIELHRERVVVRRSLRGMRMALNLPVSAFAGISLKLEQGAVAVMLEHRDPSLALPLFVSDQPDDATAEWRVWASVLGLPLLVEDDGAWREPFARIGAIRVERPQPRRRRRSALRNRRPSILMRRKVSRVGSVPIHRGEREIIARN